MTQTTSDAIDVGIRVAREFGFPIIVLLLVMWAFRESAVALHETVLVPVVESHTEFIRDTTATLRSLGDTQERQAGVLEDLAQGQREVLDRLEKPQRQGDVR